MASPKHIRELCSCLRFSAICFNVYEIHFEIKEVFNSELIHLLAIPGGEDFKMNPGSPKSSKISVQNVPSEPKIYIFLNIGSAMIHYQAN